MMRVVISVRDLLEFVELHLGMDDEANESL